MAEAIRNEILEGRLAANARLKVSELAARFQTSTNPVREALQQLRGEGFVVFSQNRGARVRQIDAAFIRDLCEVQELIEPYLARWFSTAATPAELDRLGQLVDEIEALDFQDLYRNSLLDLDFHGTIYARHFNRYATGLWRRHRDILRVIDRGHELSVARRKAILAEHRELLSAFGAHDADRAAAVMAQHVRGSAAHLLAQV